MFCLHRVNQHSDEFYWMYSRINKWFVDAYGPSSYGVVSRLEIRPFPMQISLRLHCFFRCRQKVSQDYAFLFLDSMSDNVEVSYLSRRNSKIQQITTISMHSKVMPMLT